MILGRIYSWEENLVFNDKSWERMKSFRNIGGSQEEKCKLEWIKKSRASEKSQLIFIIPKSLFGDYNVACTKIFKTYKYQNIFV
jgi:hypothetical protein